MNEESQWAKNTMLKFLSIRSARLKSQRDRSEGNIYRKQPTCCTCCNKNQYSKGFSSIRNGLLLNKKS